MDPAKANELVAKAIHLSAAEKAEVLAEYNAARGAAPKLADKPKSKVGNKTKLGNGVNMDDVLKQVADGTLSTEQASKLLAGAGNGLSVAVNPETGTICVYGLTAKWPVALYRSQWAKLIGVAEEITSYIDLHNDEIAAAEEIGKAKKAA
jgi:hypothetical protein